MVMPSSGFISVLWCGVVWLDSVPLALQRADPLVDGLLDVGSSLTSVLIAAKAMSLINVTKWQRRLVNVILSR